MATKSNCFDISYIQGICRRDFVKWVVMSGLITGFIADQKIIAEKISASTSSLTSKPDTPSTSTTSSESDHPPAYSAEDFNRMAYCGIRCQAACPENAYPESCGGCKSTDGKLGHYCEICSIRKCAGKNQVLTCAHCDDYPACDVDTWKRYPILRKKIDEIRDAIS